MYDFRRVLIASGLCRSTSWQKEKTKLTIVLLHNVSIMFLLKKNEMMTIIVLVYTTQAE